MVMPGTRAGGELPSNALDGLRNVDLVTEPCHRASGCTEEWGSCPHNADGLKDRQIKLSLQNLINALTQAQLTLMATHKEQL